MGIYNHSIFAFILNSNKLSDLKIKTPLTNLLFYKLIKFHQNYSVVPTLIWSCCTNWPENLFKGFSWVQE